MSQQINLFNPDFLKEEKNFSLNTLLHGGLLVLIGVGLFYGYAYYQLEQLKGRAGESDKRLIDEQARYEKFAAAYSPQRVHDEMQARLAKLELQVNEQGKLIETLKSGAVGNTRGYSDYMKAFSRQWADGIWLTGFSLAGDGSQIGLTGGVIDPTQLPGYIQRLNREPVMKGKSFSALQMQRTKPDVAKATATAPEFVEFSLRTTLEPTP